MKVVLAMVMSLDGKTTKGKDSNTYSWTSKEDKKHFAGLIRKNNLIVMGRKTYFAARSNIKLAKGKLRVVMTKNPKKFKTQLVPGQLEFVSDSPKEIIKKYSKLKYKNMLLIGGEKINSLFLKQKLIDEILLTIEPKIFGNGKNLFSNDIETKLKLISMKKLNKEGSLLLNYKFINKG